MSYDALFSGSSSRSTPTNLKYRSALVGWGAEAVEKFKRNNGDDAEETRITLNFRRSLGAEGMKQLGEALVAHAENRGICIMSLIPNPKFGQDPRAAKWSLKVNIGSPVESAA